MSFRLVEQNDLQTAIYENQNKNPNLCIYRIVGASKLVFDFAVLHYQYIYMFMMQAIGQQNGLKSNMGESWTYMTLVWTYLIITAILLVEVHSFHLAFRGDFRNFENACNFISFIAADTIRFVTISTYQSFVASPLIDSSEKRKRSAVYIKLGVGFYRLFNFFYEKG